MRDYIEYEEIYKKLYVNEEKKRKNNERDDRIGKKRIKLNNEDHWNWTYWYG